MTIFVYEKQGAISVVSRRLRGHTMSCPCVPFLRSIDFGTPAATLTELLTSLDVTTEPATLPARAGGRLANAVSLVRYVRQEN